MCICNVPALCQRSFQLWTGLNSSNFVINKMIDIDYVISFVQLVKRTFAIIRDMLKGFFLIVIIFSAKQFNNDKYVWGAYLLICGNSL